MRGQLTHAIIDLLSASRQALHIAEIATKLSVSDRAALNDALEDLVYDGLVSQRPGRRYRIASGAQVQEVSSIEGSLHVNARGFGFVKAPGAMDDVYVPGDSMAGAMHGDTVRARIVARTRRGREGEITDVIERGRRRVVGLLRGHFLEPDDVRIRGPIPLEDDDGKEYRGEDGVAAVIEITRYPESMGEHPRGRLLKILGAPGEPDTEVAKALAAHAVEEDHSPEAIAEAEAYGNAPPADALAGRDDLLDVPLLTIDPHDARDHDDAIWVERDDNGKYQVWIAIADVSHYVTDGTALDREALERGCSVYLPDRAVPMLPHALSTTLCSLLEGEVRLCMCVHVELDATGTVKRTRITEGKMRSRAFLSYDAVARALGFTTEPKRDPRAEELRHDLRVMWDLATLRYKKRMRRGALDLDVPEARIVVDAKTRAPVTISQRGGDPGVRKAYRIVEEMMLLANEVVAREMIDRELTAIFRVHGAPDPEKVERFAKACELLGITFDAEDASDPELLSKFLRTVEGHEKKTIVHGLLLRTMQQAMYDTHNIGHFGLASTAYLHFTSPIRRYPDLIVHRQLKGHASDDEVLRAAAAMSSEKERNAMEVEREVSDLYRALYMKQHIGETFAGVAKSITPGGIWVSIVEPFVSVLVSLDALGQDDYEPDDSGLFAIAKRSGDRINLGDEMMIVIEDVSIVRRAVYGRRLSPPNQKKQEKQRRRKGGKRQDGRRGRKKRKR